MQYTCAAVAHAIASLVNTQVFTHHELTANTTDFLASIEYCQ